MLCQTILQSAYSGLEPLVVTPVTNFINIGERTNVTGSSAFRKLIMAGDFEEAVRVASQQVESGAQMIDVNFDEGMLDGEAAMVRFLNLIGVEPDIALWLLTPPSGQLSKRVSSVCRARQWSTPSASKKARRSSAPMPVIQRYGVVVIVMAFDEQGQADTVERKVEICTRGLHPHRGSGLLPRRHYL